MNFLKNLTGKDLAMLVTSVGGIILAGFLVYFNQLNTTTSLLQASNHIDHNTKALTELTEVIRSSNDVNRQTIDVIKANTTLLQTILNKK